MPSKSDPNGQNTMERVKKEFTYMSRDSRFIVEVLGIVKDGFGSPVILMPIYPLGSLAGCTLTEKESITAFRQILVGLMHLKNFDILHRDIKPGNILIRKRTPKRFQIVLADFGIAEIFDEKAEVVNDRSDVWSTGIIMLEKMYGLDKEKFPKPESESGRAEWYARWQEEVRSKVESIDSESEPGSLMKEMLQRIFVKCDKRVDAWGCHGVGSQIKLWRRHSIRLRARWWRSWVKWVDGVPEMRKQENQGDRKRKRMLLDTGEVNLHASDVK
ncbi:ULK kinase [Fusarium napiforme]|uniref:non-specific serine/threonine protein kinase n=1 Tax=Fusarium napiforme TaxID=42672 RepID=A0A8H5J806_9HYPO|nr:ULK kinase [Fusarium napiforme]